MKKLFYLDGVDPLDLIKTHLILIAGDKRDRVVIKGTEVKVHGIIDMLGAGWTHEEIMRQNPNLTVKQIRACCAYAYLICQVSYAENILQL